MSVSEKTRREWCIGAVDSIPPGEGRAFLLGSRRIAVFRPRSGAFFATQSDCPHEGGPLADGLVGDCSVVCPLHSRRFDLSTGECETDPERRLRTFPVRESGGRVFVMVE